MMNLFAGLALSCLLFLGSYAQAQTNGFSIESSLVAAQEDLVEVNRLWEIEAAKIENYDVCKMNELSARKKYNQWFIEHAIDFSDLSREMDALVNTSNAKLNALKSLSIEVLPVAGQAASEVSVSMASLIEYFKIFNGRMKSCKPENRQDLLKHMEDPTKNSLHLSHSQIVIAMQRMSANLNSSLSERGVSYELVFTSKESGALLEFKVKFNIKGIKRDFSVSLLEGNSSFTDMMPTGDSKWSYLLQKGDLLAGMPLDALRRYRAFQVQEAGTCKNIPLLPSLGSQTLFETYPAFLAKIEKIREENRVKYKDQPWITLVNGEQVPCSEMNGVYADIFGRVATIFDACTLTKMGFEGNSWGSYIEHSTILSGNVITVKPRRAGKATIRMISRDTLEFHGDYITNLTRRL